MENTTYAVFRRAMVFALDTSSVPLTVLKDIFLALDTEMLQRLKKLHRNRKLHRRRPVELFHRLKQLQQRVQAERNTQEKF